MTQPDTLMLIARKKYMGVDVPIYHFKQPDRLNPKQACAAQTCDTRSTQIDE